VSIRSPRPLSRRPPAWLGPLLATLVLLFAWFVWPLLGLSLFV
jgi:solute carrier family 13 (sodium-dependent dicarboxylate transporter), member 2/3/5